MLVLAHRGSTDEAVAENTVAAFDRALALGADGFETDLRETADGRIVLYHDHVAGGRNVGDMTLEELRATTGRDVPELSSLLPHRHATLNLEIKTRGCWGIARHVVSRDFPHAVVTSFIHEVAEDAAGLGIEAGLLVAHAPTRRLAIAPSARLRTLVVDGRVLDRRLAHDARTTGWRLAAYALATARDHDDAVALGVEIAISDDVPMALSRSSRIPS